MRKKKKRKKDETREQDGKGGSDERNETERLPATCLPSF